MPPMPPMPGQPIISSATAAAVDSAFNALAHTVLVQNAKTLDEYEDALRLQQLPVQRGLALTRDDLLR